MRRLQSIINHETFAQMLYPENLSNQKRYSVKAIKALETINTGEEF